MGQRGLKAGEWKVQPGLGFCNSPHWAMAFLVRSSDLALPPVANGGTAGIRSIFWKRSQWAANGAQLCYYGTRWVES